MDQIELSKSEQDAISAFVDFLGIVTAGMSKDERTKMIVDELNKKYPVSE